MNPDIQSRLIAAYHELRNHTKFDKFLAYHHENPHVYEALVDLALQRRAAGFDKCSINLLVGVCRWNLDLKAGPTEDGFKIDNGFGAFYARLILAAYPELGPDFFETRVITARKPRETTVGIATC